MDKQQMTGYEVYNRSQLLSLRRKYADDKREAERFNRAGDVADYQADIDDINKILSGIESRTS